MNLHRRFFVLAGALAVGALVVASVTSLSAAPGDPEDPATTPVPQYDYGDTAKSFLVDLQFGASSATLVDASVGTERSYSHLGDPPLLQLALTDEDGNAAGTLNAWDPRWYFDEKPGGGEQLVVRNGPGSLAIPFDPDTASLLVHDQRAGIDLVTVDLRPAVQEYCAANPSDPDCVEADLTVTSSAAVGDPLGVIGEPVPVRVDAEVANLGPDGPADGDVTQTAVGTAGVTVAPASLAIDADALAVGTPETVSGDFAVTCTAPGVQSVTFTTSIFPEKAKVVDLVATNNSSSTTFSLDCAVPVTVNVKPGSLRNPVSINNGLINVAVLTTEAGEYGNPLPFDAASMKVATVRVGVRDALVATGAGAPEMHGKVHLEDSRELDEKTRDKDKDGTLHVRTNLIGLQPTTTEVCVRGVFGPGAGTTFFGCDDVEIVP